MYPSKKLCVYAFHIIEAHNDVFTKFELQSLASQIEGERIKRVLEEKRKEGERIQRVLEENHNTIPKHFKKPNTVKLTDCRLKQLIMVIFLTLIN